MDSATLAPTPDVAPLDRVHLRRVGSRLDLKPLYLPCILAEGETMDTAPIWASARGEAPPVMEQFYTQSPGVRCRRTEGTVRERPWTRWPVLTIIVSGEIELLAAGECRRLGRGGFFLCDPDSADFVQVKRLGDCRTVELGLPDDWQPADAPAPWEAGQQSTAKDVPNIKRLYQGADDYSYFKGGDSLFAGPSSAEAPWVPVVGFFLIYMPPNFFIDRHPEVVNNLVVGFDGELELETIGDAGTIQRFGRGDVCLAENRRGIGHTDRMRGHTRLAIIEVKTEDLW